MATVASIAARRQIATERISGLADQLVKKNNLTVPQVVVPHKKHELAHVVQLENIAALLDELAVNQGLERSVIPQMYVHPTEPEPPPAPDSDKPHGEDKTAAKGPEPDEGEPPDEPDDEGGDDDDDKGKPVRHKPAAHRHVEHRTTKK
jgi:hypothetical protein